MKIHRLLTIASTLLLFLLLFQQEVVAQKYKEKTNYGNTPDEMLPYNRFQEPYKLFFEYPQPFLGPGREKKPPTDLETVRIGFLGPMEGSEDVDKGKQMLQGATLALEEANAKGGYKGLPFEMMIHNDVGLWGAAANEIVKMDDENVWGILGSINDIVTHVALRVALKLEIPMVNTGDPDPTLTETRIPWIIRVVGDDRQSSYALAYHIFKEKDYSNVAILRVNSRYGRVGIGEFRDAARRLGHPIPMHVRYSEGETDFSTQLERIKQTSADAVLLWGNAKECAMIVNQMREKGMEQAVFGCDRMVSDEFVKLAGKNAEGIVTTYPYNPNLPSKKLQTFNKKYQNRFKQEPNTFAAHAYDGMNILLQSIQMAGLNRIKIRDLLTDLKTFQGYEGVTGEIVFDPSWNDVGSIWMVEIKDGKFEFKASPL